MALSNRLARALEAAVLIGALATIPLTVLGEENSVAPWVQTADWTIWAIFLIEYVVMVGFSPERIAYVKRNPLNLLVVVLSYPALPVIFGLVRLARLARFLRLLRLMTVTVRAIEALRIIFWRRGVAFVAGISVLIIFAGGTCLTLLEPQTVRGGVGDGVWWAIVTAATVGYGDIAPTTLAGRLIAVALMLTGVGLISTLAASITAYFLGTGENAGMVELNERMARVEGLLNALLSSQTPVPREATREALPMALDAVPEHNAVPDRRGDMLP
jgi:voltage-gated potassium channel